MKTTKGEPRREGDSLFMLHTVIEIPDPRGFKVGQDFMTRFAVDSGGHSSLSVYQDSDFNIERCATT